MIKRARPKDIPHLVELAKKFIEESDWGWTFDEEKSIENFYNYMQSEDCIVLMSPNGFARLAYDHEDSIERVGYISKFYISPAGRGTHEGRSLLGASTAWFDHNNCVRSFATATANIKTEKNAFKNLMAKYGYRECGETLVRGLNEQG